MNQGAENSFTKTEVEDVAAAWVLKIERGLTRTEQAAFDHWLEKDRTHAQRFADTKEIWTRLDATTALRSFGEIDPDLLAPRANARRSRWAIVGAIAAVLTCGFFLHQRGLFQPASVTTSVEHHTLADGTAVSLNIGSSIRVSYAADMRRVNLVQGEGYFEVAKDAARPFIVNTGAVEFVAVGTVFNVRQAEEAIELTVVEGKVQVSPLRGALSRAEQGRLLEAGQRAIVPLTRGGDIEVVRLSAAETGSSGAWRNPLLQFNATPLAAVIEDFNRFNVIKLRIVDDTLAEERVSGTFRADNMQGLVRLLKADYGVSVESSGNTLVLKKIAAAAAGAR